MVHCAGKVTGPLEGTESWFTAPTPALTEAPTAPMDTYAVDLESVLSGGQYYHATLEVPTYSGLECVTIELDFDPLDDTRAASKDLQYVIEDPSKRSIAFGGADISYPTASVTTSWPESMYPVNGKRKGTFTAKLGIRYAKLRGVGTWTFYHLNALSSSGPVKYKSSATLQFKSGGLLPSALSVSPSPPSVGDVSSAVMTQELPEFLSRGGLEFLDYNIAIPLMTLEVYASNGVIVRESAFLTGFPFTGIFFSLPSRAPGLDLLI